MSSGILYTRSLRKRQKGARVDPDALLGIYKALHRVYGAQGWWPAKTRLEVILGAILTQNTAWTNVEKAIRVLRQEKLLSLKALKSVSCRSLGRAIRSAGFFNVKASRIQAFVKHIENGYKGSLNQFLSQPTEKLRDELLSISGIGPETADSILLYAANRPVFVVDAYTRRIYYRLGLLAGEEGYEEIRSFFESRLPKKSSIFNEYHALIVRHAKETCRKKPLCEICPLNAICPKRL